MKDKYETIMTRVSSRLSIAPLFQSFEGLGNPKVRIISITWSILSRNSRNLLMQEIDETEGRSLDYWRPIHRWRG